MKVFVLVIVFKVKRGICLGKRVNISNDTNEEDKTGDWLEDNKSVTIATIIILTVILTLICSYQIVIMTLNKLR